MAGGPTPRYPRPVDFPQDFSGLQDLARLPWFSVVEGALALDPAVGGVIDVHTHLALSWLLPQSVDLRRDTGRTEHYLPPERAFGFQRYLNQYFTADDRKKMEADLVWGPFRRGGPRHSHTAGNLGREMGDLQVRRSVLLPIDWPLISSNATDWLHAAAAREDMVVFGSVHPFAANLEAKLDAQVALGARGMKFHPAVQLLGPDHPRVLRLARACGARKLPLFFHCGPVGIDGPGARRRTQVDRYRLAIESCPDTTFVLGHTGALQHEQAVELARQYPNVWVELASQGLPVVRTILERVDPERICFGSDWPFYPQAIGIAKVLVATEGAPEARRQLLHDNAARLLGLAQG